MSTPSAENNASVKTVVVTGGTAGLGLEALKQLIARSDEVYYILIGCRKIPSTEEADVLRNHRSSSQTTIEYLPLDLASYSSVEFFSEQVKDKLRTRPHAEIDALFLCAGAVFPKYEVMTLPNGRRVEKTIFVNVLSHAIIAKDLLSSVSSTGRIAIVNSGLHVKASKKTSVTPKYIDSIADSASKWPGGQPIYGISKLVEMHLTFIINDKVQSSGSKATVVSSHPGFVPDTSLAREFPWILRMLVYYVLPLFTFSTSLRTGGSTLLRSIVDDSLPTTTYVSPKGVDTVAPECNDTELRAQWVDWFRGLGVWD